MKKYPVTKLMRPGGMWHLMLIAAVFVYALVVEILTRLIPFRGMLFEPNVEGMMRTTFVVIGLASLIAALIFLLRPRLVRTIKGWEELIVTWGSVVMTFMLVYAFLEAIAIYGLTLFMVTGNQLDFYGFAVTSFVALLLLWTQRGRWEQLIALEQAEMKEAE
jgi:hypothetical protein